MTTMLSRGLLQGVRVLDLSRILAGPFATMNLADMGADVVKIEHPVRGDDTVRLASNRRSSSLLCLLAVTAAVVWQRSWGPPFVGNGSATQATYFTSVNRSKRSVAVDLSHPSGAQAVRRLAARADVLIENFLPGKLAQYGLDYASVVLDNTGLVYCSLTGYGQTGPDRLRAGYDVAVAAEGGLMSVTGEAEGPPVKVGVAVTDLLTGLHAVNAILAVLLERTRTGRGRHVDVALFDCQLGSLANVSAAALNTGQTPARWGSAHASIVPYQAFVAADERPLIVSAMSDSQFRTLVSILDEPFRELLGDARFATNAGRVAHRDQVVTHVQAALRASGLGRDDWLIRLQRAGLAASPINSVLEAFASPQAVARGAVVELHHPETGTIRCAAPAVRVAPAGIAADAAADTEAIAARSPPPLLGEHTADVLCEWGALSAAQVAEGVRDQWLAQRRPES